MIRLIAAVASLAAALLAAACSSSTKPALPATHVAPVTAAGIHAVFAATKEVDYADEHFAAQATAVTPDGHGGTFTAALGLRDPSGDGKGMIVGFWHNDAFVGLAQNFEVLALNSVRAAGPGRFTLVYVNYRDSDPLCCPSGKPTLLPITYEWNGKAFATAKPLPENLYRSGAEIVAPPK
jgi:hypothetical protein